MLICLSENLDIHIVLFIKHSASPAEMEDIYWFTLFVEKRESRAFEHGYLTPNSSSS